MQALGTLEQNLKLLQHYELCANIPTSAVIYNTGVLTFTGAIQQFKNRGHLTTAERNRAMVSQQDKSQSVPCEITYF